MKVLVSGGAGFIGSHIVADLLKIEHTPIIVDNFHNSQPAVVERIRQLSGKDFLCIRADILDAEQLRRIFNQHKIEAVIHLAALKSVTESLREPRRYYENNVGGLLQLLKVMEANECRTFIFSSSATIFGTPDKLPITENAPFKSTNPYGGTKIASEYILQDIAQAQPGWKIISLRYFNPAGAHSSGLLGEMPPPGEPANLFPAIIYAYRNSDHKFKIYGDDYDTQDGTSIRDFLHIMDLSQAHIKALEKCAQSGFKGYRAVNLGSGKGYTVMEIVRTFEKITRRKLPYTQMPRRPGDVAVNYTSTRFAQEFLGWRTQKSLHNMCADALRFMESSA